MERIVLHIDVNSAFLSWSALKLLEEGYKKDIRNEIAVIAGDPNKRHGVIVAASIPAKKIGIKPPVNLFEARKLCKDLIVVKPDFNYYKKKSDAMMNFIKKLFPDFQQYSIDECFVEYTSMKRLYKDEVKFAYKLKNEIYKRFGFTVNIGIGNNKVCAKMASDFEKPFKVHTLYKNEFKEKMFKKDISELFMAGKSSCKKLRELNINTIEELATSDVNMLIRHLKSQGKLLYEYANGIDDSKVENQYDERKGIGFSKTLEDDTDNIDELFKYLKEFSERISKELNRRGLYASTLVVTIRNNEFKTNNHQKKYTNSFYKTEDIFEKAKEVLIEFWDRESVRLIGLRVTDLNDSNSYQLSLFEDNNIKEDDKKIQELIEKINDQYGKNSIFKGTKL
jgi:DNA polymerase-4